MSGALAGGLLRIRHDQHDLEFLSGRVVSDNGGAWCLRVQAPRPDQYREHLLRGAPMGLTLVARGGDTYSGEACVASVTATEDGVTLVVLSGVGPLVPQ